MINGLALGSEATLTGKENDAVNSNESRASSVTWCIIYEETPNSIDYTDVKARSRERYIKRLGRAKCAGTREDFVPLRRR